MPGALTRECNFPRVVGEALDAYRLVRKKGADDEAVYCDAGEKPEGVVFQKASSDDVTDSLSITIEDLMLQFRSLPMVASGSISQVDGGAEVYTDDDGKVTATNTGYRVGRLRDKAGNVAGADGDIVEVVPDPDWVAFVNTAISAEVENTTTETDFDKTFTIPANTLQVGDVFDIWAHVHVIDNNSTDTLTLRLKIGSVLLLASAALDVEDDDIAIFHGRLVVRTIGATGTIFGSFIHGFDVAGTAAGVHEKAEATLDTTADQVVKVTAEWSVAHADNEVRLDVLNVFKLPR